MAVFTPTQNASAQSRAANGLNAYLRLLALEADVKDLRKDYAAALKQVRTALRLARLWRLPHWDHLTPADRQSRFRGHLKWAEDCLVIVSRTMWRLQCAERALAQYPLRTFDDCMLGLSIAELSAAEDLCARWASMPGAHWAKRHEQERKMFEVAHLCRERMTLLSKAPSPTDYVKYMNDALGLGAA